MKARVAIKNRSGNLKQVMSRLPEMAPFEAIGRLDHVMEWLLWSRWHGRLR